MANPQRFDVAVVGAEVAGLVAAARASELGLRVAVLERGIDDDYMCNSRITGGVFHIGMNNILLDPPVVRQIIEKAAHGHSDPELADALANNARRVIDWLRSQGVQFIKGPTPDMNAVLSPPKLAQFGLHWKGRGGDVLLRTLGERLAERGGIIMRGVSARDLIVKGGKCVGVVIERDAREEEIEAGAVVLADGGFQANLEMVGNYISPAPEKVFQRNAGTAFGDGIRMAARAGAKLVDLDCFYGHVLHREAFTNDNLWPYPMIDLLAMAGMVVDAEGRRFVDEGLGGIYVANAIARLADPLSTTVVFDDRIWNGPGRGWILTPNPNITVAGGTILEADDLANLAAKANLPADGLSATVAEYNKAIENGTLAKLRPARSPNGATDAMPIKVPPFRAIPTCAGITYTMGGIAIDGSARVLRPDGVAIEGLFAAGSTTGGLEGGPLIGYTGGLSKAATTGFLAAESIATIRGRVAARAAS